MKEGLRLKYFNYLSEQEIKEIFYKEPENFIKNENKDILACALGATLYMPGIRDRISIDIIEKKIMGLMSVIICLEDSVGDSIVENGLKNVITQINKIDDALKKGIILENDIPFIFIRIRSLEQMQSITMALGEKVSLLTGFVIPKFSYINGEDYFNEIEDINRKWNTCLYAMPVIETKDIIYLDNRLENLKQLKELFDRYKHLILNVRIGATDFSSLFGIRRNINNVIYDISVIRDCLASIINMFGRYEDNYVISGPVWEYFTKNTSDKDYYLEESISGLIREGMLDKENGLFGKTVIHPSQIIPIQSLQVVTYEEYMDACDIIYNENSNNGVVSSTYKNKMNEVKPHLNWAKKTIKKSYIYGVYNENKSYKDLLGRK